MKTHLRAITGLTLATAGASLALTAVTPAFAHETGTSQVAWLVTSGSFDNRFGTPQTLYTGSLECGVGLIQYDTYDTSTPEHAALVQALIDGGTLNSGQDTPIYLSNTDLELSPCPTPTASTPVTTTPPTTTPPATEPTAAPTPSATSPAATPTSTPTATPAPIPPTATPTAPQTAPATSPTTAATSPSPSQPTTQSQPSTPGGKSSSNQLAYTGSNTGPALALAAILLTGGLILLVIRKKRA